MKKTITRVLAVLAILVLGVILPACATDGYSTTTYVGVGYGVYGGYGGYYGAGCCYGGGYGGVVVRPPIYSAPRPVHY